MNPEKRKHISAVRATAGAKGARAVWGEKRPPCRAVRVNEDAYFKLVTVPRVDRRKVASEGIKLAVKKYWR